MVRVTEELALSAEHVALYHTTDPLVGHLPVLVFYGPSTTANYTLNSSRVQVHVFGPAGFQSFPRLTISPSSPFYGAVDRLPREFQGDEVYRGLAFGLLKYFTELPEVVKKHLRNQYPTTKGRRPGSAPALFGEQHAADLAKSMVKSEQTAEVIRVLESALQTQHVSNVDIDLVLPPGSIVPLQPADLEEVPDDEDDILDPTLRRYVGYGPLVKLFGEAVFVPTSRLRRAPSKPTTLNRTRSFGRDQKLELRFKLGELVDTEERYVLKLNELVRHIADDFRQAARNRPAGSASPTEDDVAKLFPPSVDAILSTNTAFMEELRKIMDESEEEAMKDMDIPFTGGAKGAGGSLKMKDPTGALAMARIFLEWFPKFTDCYQDYIRASQNFPQLLNSFLNQQSSFRQRVNDRGEQNIRSILIEPVQRLPRYSLFIDQIVGCLPLTHPALQPMLRARDIIANICSMDDPLPDKPHVTNRLRSMVESWPMDLEPDGRLIVAADFTELTAPYHLEGTAKLSINDHGGIFLLFSDCLVILKKKSVGSLAGRDLLREIDKPSAAGLLASMTNAAGGTGSYDMAFAGWHPLADVRFTESADGRLVWMTSTEEMRGAHAGEHVTSTAATSRCFLLQESYEGKAAKWSEEVAKARVEGRFPEPEREDPCWCLRSVKMADSNLGLFTAVFQEGVDQLVPGRKEPAPIRIVVDHEKGTKGAPVGHYGVEIVLNMQTGDMKRLSVDTCGLHGKLFSDEVALEDLLPTISRRIIQLLSSQFNTANVRLASSLISYNTKVLRGLNFNSRGEKSRSFLATSPVKLLSSFLGGGSTSENTYATAPKLQRTPLGNVATLFPAQTPQTNQAWFGSGRNRDGSRTAMDEGRPENPLVRLEQTFTGYVASLQGKKGNIVSRMLLNRASTDELAVNDLYNRLIENPFDLDASADVGADVVFAAFEKFLRIAWREQMGPIMSKQALNALQERAIKRVPGDFADFVSYLFSDMAPQNRRAFTAVIKLLADLLDGCGNDGDRGAMTLAFAELLVNDGTAQYYINLLDRLVEDCDRIFDDVGFGSNVHLGGSAYESFSSTARSSKSASGSLTSNTSSLRRKFGFDALLRQNGKGEPDARSSMWRSLSKHGGRNVAGDLASFSSSMSKTGSMNRSRSIDVTSQGIGSIRGRRPGSKDRPPVAGSFDEVQRPASSHRLETIGEPEPSETLSAKKKRRSSLSDLRGLMAATSLDDTPLMPLRINKQTGEKFNSGPRVPPPSRIPVSPTSQNLGSSRQKENIPAQDASEKEQTAPAESDKQTNRAAKTLSMSAIPILKPAQRPGSGGGESPSRPGSSPTRPAPLKTKVQSPQKLRERLQAEKDAVEEADASLKAELSKIGEEMARLGGGDGSGNKGTLPRSTATVDLRRLAASVKALEERIPVVVADMAERHSALQREMEPTIRATEAKVRAIDQLYRETTAENELLYEKFNSELAKIVRALKGKGREDKEELVARLKDASEETARVKKENARLRREMASLRAALKGTSGGSSSGSGGQPS